MYLGIDVGGTNLAAGLTDREGRIVRRTSRPVDQNWTAERLAAELAELSRRTAEEAGCPAGELEAVGLGMPGLVNNRDGVVVKTPNLPFQDTPVRALFQEKLNVPVCLGNDADCAAAGEYWAGAARGCDPALVITLGTGVGSGLVKDGTLYTGFGGAGLEAGHMVVHPGGQRCGCGARGCWEQYGSATALIRMAREELEAAPDSLLGQLCGGNLQAIEGRTVFQAARQRDPAALRALERYWDELSVGLINLINLLFPEIVCLGGGISGAEDELLLDPLRKRVVRGCFDKNHLPRIVRAQLGNDAGIVGAAMLCKLV